MKVTVDLEDFYLEEDESLSDALKSHVTHHVIQDIWGKIKLRVEQAITETVIEKVNSTLDVIIQQRMHELLEVGEIIRHNKPVKITDHINDTFMANSLWNNPNDFIKKRADVIGEELKSRYDVAFATAIVMNLNQNGMLKEEISKMLLDSPPKA